MTAAHFAGDLRWEPVSVAKLYKQARRAWPDKPAGRHRHRDEPDTEVVGANDRTQPLRLPVVFGEPGPGRRRELLSHTEISRHRATRVLRAVLTGAIPVLILAAVAVLAACVPSDGTPATPPDPPAPATTGPTPEPPSASPLIVSVERDGLAPAVAELLGVHGGSAVR